MIEKVDRVYDILKPEGWFSELSLDMQGEVSLITASVIGDLDEPVVIIKTAKKVSHTRKNSEKQ